MPPPTDEPALRQLDPIRQTLSVYPAAALRVTEGVAEGDALSFADELMLDDIYQIVAPEQRGRLTVVLPEGGGPLTVAEGSELGAPGHAVHMDCCLTLMGRDGLPCEALVLVEVDAEGVAEIYLLPLVALRPRSDYRLVGVDRHAATQRLAEVACVSFSRGTQITMASGAQVRIEDLVVGDRVLTRDDGPQPIRWIGQTTLRAVGAFAPVVIAKGALHNENDLVVSPDHRIFVYQRQDHLGAGRAEVLIKARHLINGTTVTRREDGGFLDYFQLLFDNHQIIYAEGIAAESLLIDPRTRAAVPGDMADLSRSYRPHLGYEVQESLLSAGDAVALLRRASGSD